MHYLICMHLPLGAVHPWALCLHIRLCTLACVTTITCILMFITMYYCLGALNHQTTHHLFPGIIQSHYRKITPIVVQTCKEFGIKYNYVDTTSEALACHLLHLKRLGQCLVYGNDDDKKD